jgi:hypothetical protein
VHLTAAGDAVFPPIDPAIWRQSAGTAHPAGPDDDAPYEIATYIRA